MNDHRASDWHIRPCGPVDQYTSRNVTKTRRILQKLLSHLSNIPLTEISHWQVTIINPVCDNKSATMGLRWILFQTRRYISREHGAFELVPALRLQIIERDSHIVVPVSSSCPSSRHGRSIFRFLVLGRSRTCGAAISLYQSH